MSTPYQFHSSIHTLNYERQSLEIQLKTAYLAYREEQSSRDPQAWALAAYRKRMRMLSTRRRQHIQAMDQLRLASA